MVYCKDARNPAINVTAHPPGWAVVIICDIFLRLT